MPKPAKIAPKNIASVFAKTGVGIVVYSTHMMRSIASAPLTAIGEVCIYLMFLAFPAFALPPVADSLAAARQLGSDPLILGIATTLPQGTTREAVAKRLRAKMGFDPGQQPAPTRLTIQPIVQWDGNVNGGYQNDTIEIAGLPFHIDARYRAQGGMTFGAQAQISNRHALAQDLALETQASLRATYAPSLEMWKSSVSTQTCLRNRHSDRLYFFGCASGQLSHTALADTIKLTQSAGLSHVFIGKGVHALTFDIGSTQARRDSHYEQGFAHLAWQGAFSGGRAAFADLTIFTPAPGVMVPRESFTLGTIVSIKRHPIGLQFGWQHYSGGQFLGEAAHRQIHSLRLTSSLSPKVQANIELFRTTGSHDFYKEQGVNLTLSWKL